MISDLKDVLNSIPHQVKKEFESIHLFNVDLLTRLTRDNEIDESKVPLITLLSKMASLSEVRRNGTVARELEKLLSSRRIRQLASPIITSYQLRPLLLEFGHVQQINIDYLTSILHPEILSYLNLEEFANISDDNIKILSTIVDYLLYQEPMYIDYDMQKHLQSLMLIVNPSKVSSKRHLSKSDWEKMMILVPSKKDFAPVKIFLQSDEVYKYIFKDTDWKLFPTSMKKLLHLLSLIESSENKNESANRLRNYLEERFNFVIEQDLKSMHHALASLKLKYDLVPLKIFLNHDNLISIYHWTLNTLHIAHQSMASLLYWIISCSRPV